VLHDFISESRTGFAEQLEQFIAINHLLSLSVAQTKKIE
jgi:hypothetical protein